MMKNKLSGDSRGIATIIIAVVVVIIIAGAGVVAYAVISNNNNSGNSSNNTTDSSLGGSSLVAGESLTYNITGGVTGNIAGVVINESNALFGTITIACAQGSGDTYTITVTLDMGYDIDGIGSEDISDILGSDAIHVTFSSLDMKDYGKNTTDLSTLSDYGYTSAEISSIQNLIGRYDPKTVNFDTVDGNIKVEERTYTYNWNDLKSLIPDIDGIDQNYIKDLSAGLSLWFGQNLLYKADFTFHIAMDVMENGGSDFLDMNGSIVLASHT